jgi:CheY-like chemotaxis protein
MNASPRRRPGARTILVVDDDDDVRSLIRAVVERRGYRVVTAADGAEALDLIARAAPDLVLLDVDLPGADGPAVCRRLKADPATRAIPVLVLTVDTREADRQRGLAAGADGSVTKPFSPRSLLDRLGAHLGTD